MSAAQMGTFGPRMAKAQAIVEVKRRERAHHSPYLEMQEAAEMVGWIMDDNHRPDPSLVGR